ncbi:MAG: TIGR02996 domain-containing protein [Kofleriaceae bacterium]
MISSALVLTILVGRWLSRLRPEQMRSWNIDRTPPALPSFPSVIREWEKLPPRAGVIVKPIPIEWQESPDEEPFFRALRNRPGDELARMAYADWLEERGQVGRASFVRGETVGYDQLEAHTREAWRIVVSRQPTQCSTKECPDRWDGFDATEDDRVRRCRICGRSVHWVAADARIAYPRTYATVETEDYPFDLSTDNLGEP